MRIQNSVSSATKNSLRRIISIGVVGHIFKSMMLKSECGGAVVKETLMPEDAGHKSIRRNNNS